MSSQPAVRGVVLSYEIAVFLGEAAARGKLAEGAPAGGTSGTGCGRGGTRFRVGGGLPLRKKIVAKRSNTASSIVVNCRVDSISPVGGKEI